LRGALCQGKKHKEKEGKFRSELGEFTRLFRLFGMSDGSNGSEHAELLKQEAEQEQQGAEGYSREIDVRREYYTALAQEDYGELWQHEDEASHLAAIYFGMKHEELWNNRGKLDDFSRPVYNRSERVAKYLIVKLMFAVDSKYTEPAELFERPAVSEVLSISNGHSSYNKEDTIWKGIVKWLDMHAFESILVTCKQYLQECKKAFSSATDYLTDYESSKSSMTRELEMACSKARNGEPAKVANEVMDKLRKRFDQMDYSAKEWKKIVNKAENCISQMEDMQRKLEWLIANDAEGNFDQTELEKCRKDCPTFFVYEMERECKKLLSDVKKGIEEIQVAIKKDADRELAAKRYQAQLREERRRRKREWKYNHPVLNIVCWIVLIPVLVWAGIDRVAWASVYFKQEEAISYHHNFDSYGEAWSQVYYDICDLERDPIDALQNYYFDRMREKEHGK